MNASNARDYLPLVQALAEGKVIQVVNIFSGGWVDITDMDLGAPADQYRIKTEPREIWRNRFPNGIECGTFYSQEEARQWSVGEVQHVRYREVIE